jgi:exopolysaccharide biosynthesis protein
VGCKKVSEHGSQAHAIAAVNGGFFDGSCKSVSFLKLDAVLKAFNSKSRSVLGIDGQERMSIKRVPAGQDWPEARNAIGGIPRIVTDGVVDVNSEGASQSFINNRNPRTAVGLIDDQTAIIVMVDGRSSESKGMSLKALAQFMISLGAKQAVNLDGGGSSAMWIDPKFGDSDGVINRPSDGRERRVNSALAVFAPAGSGGCF